MTNSIKKGAPLVDKALVELIRDANREITPATRHAILDLIEQQAAGIAEREAQLARLTEHPVCVDCGDTIMAHDPGTCGTCHAIKYASAAMPAVDAQPVGQIAHNEVDGFHFVPSVHWLEIGIGTTLYIAPKTAKVNGPVKPQIGTSEQADFERGTWTFTMQPGFVVTAGEYLIVQKRQPAEGSDADSR